MLTKTYAGCIISFIFALALIACEGPAGERGPTGTTGPTGERGPRGPSGESAAHIVIEHTFHGETDGWDEEWKSYTISDARFRPNMGHLLQVWIKQFYTNTGGLYYEDFSEWKEGGAFPVYQVGANFIRFYDPNQRLEGNTALIVIGP